MPLRFTYFTPDSVLPLVRARYGWHARGCTSQSRQKARHVGWNATVFALRGCAHDEAPGVVHVIGTEAQRDRSLAVASAPQHLRAPRVRELAIARAGVKTARRQRPARLQSPLPPGTCVGAV
jgi:hypothetical protein